MGRRCIAWRCMARHYMGRRCMTPSCMGWRWMAWHYMGRRCMGWRCMARHYMGPHCMTRRCMGRNCMEWCCMKRCCMERSTHRFISFLNGIRYAFFQLCWGALNVVGRVVPPHVCVVSVTVGIVALSLILFLGSPIELCFGFYL